MPKETVAIAEISCIIEERQNDTEVHYGIQKRKSECTAR